jgi:hypothetical protein
VDPAVLAAISALAAAAAWGSGDFTGGLVARRVGPVYTVLISYAVGLLALVILALAWREAFPAAADLVWGALAGVSGMVGLGFLRGFTTGRMGIVAPVSAVLAATLPVVSPRSPRAGRTRCSCWVSRWRLRASGCLAAGAGGRPAAGHGAAGRAGVRRLFILLDQINHEAFSGRWSPAARWLRCCWLRVGDAGAPAVCCAPRWLLALAGVLDAGGNLFFCWPSRAGAWT